MKKSSSNINSDADSYLPDNLTEEISAGDVRDRVKDIADSFLNLSDGGLVIDAQTGYSTPITPSSNYSFGTKKYIDDGLATKQPLATNLTSLSGLTYASTSFVKMTASGTFALDTNTYALNSDLGAYLKLDLSNSPLTGSTLTTTQTTFNLLNTTVTTLNAFGVATVITLGATSGTCTIRNTNVLGTQPGVSLWNTVATTVNFAGAATSLSIGDTSTQTKSMSLFGGATISGATKTLNVGVNGASGSITNINIGSSISGATGTISLYHNTTITGIAQNALNVNNGIKIGNNTDSASTAGAGSIRYASNKLDFSEGSNWRNIVSVIPTNTKVTAGAPYTNDGYIIVTINGTDYKLMTTA